MREPGSCRPSARALALTVSALVATLVVWELRPAAPAASVGPDVDVARGCAWLAWLLAGYLSLAIAAAGAGELATRRGHPATWLRRVVPRPLRTMVQGLMSVGVAASVLTSVAATPAGAAALPASSTLVGSPLDWPGLGETVIAPVSPPPGEAASPPIRAGANHRAHPPVGLVAGGSAAGDKAVGGSANRDSGAPSVVVVRPGDSLWSIAAGDLPAGTPDAAVTAAWHEWYAANRRLIGDDPGLLVPGQRLIPPQIARSTR